MVQVRCPCNRVQETNRDIFQCRKCGKRSRTLDFVIQDMGQTPTQLPTSVGNLDTHEVIQGHLIYN